MLPDFSCDDDTVLAFSPLGSPPGEPDRGNAMPSRLALALLPTPELLESDCGVDAW